jgi:5-methylcytosine-specific restriction enzyme subunit McrC
MKATASDQLVAIRMSEWTTVGPDGQGIGAALRGLSFDAYPQAARKAVELERSGILSVTEGRHGLAIQTRSYIGRLRLGPLDLTIVPKISWDRWLVLVTFALRLRGLLRGDRVEASRLDELALRDIIFLELLAEVRDLLGRGLHRDYVAYRANLASPRGRIDFGRIARAGGHVGPELPSRFTRRSDDSSLNRALLAALRYTAARAQDRVLKTDAARLARELDRTVERVPLDRSLLQDARSSLDRRTRRYQPALTLIELLLNGESISLDEFGHRRTVEITGFAMDMNVIWQRLLGRVLSEWSEGFTVEEESRLRDVFRRSDSHPYRGRTPTPRPDFAAFHGDRLVGYLDAKYRDLWARSLPREMLYQLAVYAVAQGGGVVAILYPTDSREAREQRIDLQDPILGERRATIALRPVQLSHLEALISAPPTEQNRVRRADFARALLRGGDYWPHITAMLLPL